MTGELWSILTGAVRLLLVLWAACLFICGLWADREAEGRPGALRGLSDAYLIAGAACLVLAGFMG